MPLPRSAHRVLQPLLVIAAILGLVGAAEASQLSHSTGARLGAAPTRFFSPSGFWNRRLPAKAQLAGNSRGMVSALKTIVNAELHAKNGPWINSGHDGVTIITVGANQRTVVVRLDHSPDAALTAAWSAVPLPRWARPSGGDNDLAVWQPSTNRMWEFFQLNRRRDGWHAEWGGAMQNVSTNSGVYGPTAWPDAKNWWGVTAASLPIVGGAMTDNDLATGEIDHALALIVPNVRDGAFASPAQRCDGVSYARNSLPEGAHLRLDPRLNLTSLSMPPLTRMMARAAQRYGIIIRDRSPIIAFVAQDPTTPRSNLLHGIYGGQYPWQLMASFPWSHLQVLKMTLHRKTC